MDSDLSKLRAAAEPFKSFPKAVAAVVRAMFDRGAESIRISSHSDPMPWMNVAIIADKPVFSMVETRPFLEQDFNALPQDWRIAFVHHSQGVDCTPYSYKFADLGKGEGVNKKQDRSAKRLVCELPKLLSPREAFHVTIVDEAGEAHRLVKNLPSTVIDGLRLSWPEKMVGFGREGLTLKFGAVRVSLKSFIARLILEPKEREQLMLLTHPWLRGIIEVEVADPQVANIPVPPEPVEVFMDFFHRRGYAEQLAKAILHIVPAVALREMNKMVMADVGDFCNGDGELRLGDQRYKLVCVDEVNLWRVEHVALAGYFHQEEPPHEMVFNPTHPIFRTIGPDRDEIMQVIWWQLAIRIAQEHPEVFEKSALFNLRVNQIYLALREQNPEHWDE